MAQHWPSSQESSVYVDFNVNDEQSIQMHGSHSTPLAGFQWQLASHQDNIFGLFFTDPDDLSCTSPTCTSPTFVQTPVIDANRPWMAEERNEMALEHDDLLSLDFYFQGPFPQADNSQVLWPLNEGADFHMSWPIIDSSPRSHVGPSTAGHLSSQDMTDINPEGLFQFPFGENEHSQPGQVPWSSLTPPSRAAGPLTSSTTTIALSTHSPLRPSAEDDIRTVGSPQIQQAAARRRKKDGLYQCPFDNCISTFTELHNLQYHKNAHLGSKPYKCTKCSYAANSPTTLKRHMKRHPDTKSCHRDGLRPSFVHH